MPVSSLSRCKLAIGRIPAVAGWSREKLTAARDYSATIHSSSVMIVEHGVVIDAWGDVAKKISSYSVRKSLISALYGIYSAEGVIDINQSLQQLGIDDAPDPLTAQEKQARVVDLLRARSGVYHLVDFETPYMNKMRPTRDSHRPARLGYYNNWDFNALGTIFQCRRPGWRSATRSISASPSQLVCRILGVADFQPLSVGRFRSIVHTISRSRRAISHGFSLLYLRLGCWEAKQIVPRSWVQKSSHADEMVQAFGEERRGL